MVKSSPVSYQRAVEEAWKDVLARTTEGHIRVKFLSDIYNIDLTEKRVVSAPGNTAAKDHVTIILLHYLAAKLAAGKLPELSGEWIDFNELEGGEGYYPAFKKRTIDPIIRKYGTDPDALSAAAGRMGAKQAKLGDVSVIIHPLEQVAILVKMSRADEEFAADANILFDSNISRIFRTEDIVVLTESIVHKL